MSKTSRFFMTLLLLVCSVATYAQDIQVTGTVVQKIDNEPVIGATVIVVGSASTGTVTDFDGNFQLTVPKDAELQFSYVGLQTLTLKAEPVMNVVMDDDAQMMQEVVVTGYTVQRKADLSGAISVVDTKALKAVNENNPMKALQGRVPGMNISADGNPSGSATVRIRGIGTLNDNIYR